MALDRCLQILNQTKLLTGDQREANLAALQDVLSLEDEEKNALVVRALEILVDQRYLHGDEAQAIYETLLLDDGEYVGCIIEALEGLHNAGLLQEGLPRLPKEYLSDFATWVSTMAHAHLLTPINYKLYIQNLAPEIGRACEILSSDPGLLTQETYRGLLENPQHALGVAGLFSALYKTQLLTGELEAWNRKAIVHYAPYAQALALMIPILNRAGLLQGEQGQANLKALFDYAPLAKNIWNELVSNSNKISANSRRRGAVSQISQTILTQDMFFEVIKKMQKLEERPAQLAASVIAQGMRSSSGPFGKLPKELAASIVGFFAPVPELPSEKTDSNYFEFTPGEPEKREEGREPLSKRSVEYYEQKFEQFIETENKKRRKSK